LLLTPRGMISSNAPAGPRPTEKPSAFHDAVLKNGGLPLEEQTNEYIQRKTNAFA
jgi:hypothetical protein